MPPTPSGEAGAALPDELAAALSGEHLGQHVGWTLQLFSNGEDGWPSVALLSVGEVLALGSSRLRLALWPGSRTTANLSRTGRGVLAFVHDKAFYTLRLEVNRLADLPAPGQLAAFQAELVGLRRDEVPYAELSNGITFELFERPAVISRWQAALAALRALPGDDGGAGGQ